MFTAAKFLFGAVIAAADRLEGMVNLQLWRVMR
jgi:hypothetical protein